MRFETDVLAYTELWGEFVGSDCEHKNWACRTDIVARGWNLPRRNGSRIVLVFSTTPVRGASRCNVYNLRRAGRVAIYRAASVEERMTFNRLWWWPEIVTGGS